MTSGAGLKQIIVQPCGVPGEDSCPFSALQTVALTTTSSSTVITDIGELLFMQNSDTAVSLTFQTATGVWTDTGWPSTSQVVQLFSDGTNLRFESSDTSTTRSGTYYIIQ